VAKVVGVTTDTVSRWENNRYPSIKRDNVSRLAEALDCSMTDIIRKEAEEIPSPLPQATSRLPLFVLLFIIVLGGGVLLMIWRHAGAPSQIGFSAERLLPDFAAPGTVIPVRIRLDMEPDLKGGYILREHFPPGWKLVEANPPASSLDNEEGAARWIIKQGESRRLIVYLVKVAADAKTQTEATFRGEVIANPNGRTMPLAAIDNASRVRRFRLTRVRREFDTRIRTHRLCTDADQICHPSFGKPSFGCS
jgi:transcriptional regulator with XRE-family HTH domain